MSEPMKNSAAAAKPKRRYDDQFKRRAVELTERGDRTVREVARELGMGEDLLYAWRREHGVAIRRGVTMPTQPRSVSEIERENRELRAKLSDMEAREIILKKSLGILSETPGSGMPKWKR
jgi:transposase